MNNASDLFGCFLIFSLVALSMGAHAEPIHEAAVDGDVERVRQLLSEGADVDARDPAGTPLQWALFANQAETARVLLEHGANPNLEGPSGTPLLQAAAAGNAELVDLLLEHGSDPNQGDQSKPLNAAAREGNLQIVELLLERGAKPTIATFDGVTALHEAAKAGHLDIAERLVQQGADVNAMTASGKPPIHLAVSNNHPALAAFLRESGAAPGEIAPIGQLLAAASPVEGELVAEPCAACHHFKGQRQFVGPSLWNVVGRARASVDGFAYSRAFSALDGTWTYELLNAFLARPMEVVPGTKMDFPGVSDPKDRANLIVYLRTLSEAPVPLP